MKKILRTILFLILFTGIWEVLTVFVNNAFIFPSIFSVFEQMINQAESPFFFGAIGSTILKAMSSLCLSFFAGLLLSFLSRKNSFFSYYLERIVSALQSVPNISIIILLLFWLPRELCVFCISFLLVFPIVYHAIHQQLINIEKKWGRLFKIYPQPFYYRLFNVYLPLLKPTIISCFLSAISLSFKSVVMAEVLCQAKDGIGRYMQMARLDVNIAGVIGWTFWLVLLVLLFDSLTKLFIKKMEG